MKTISKCGCQGDVLFRRILALPKGVVEVAREKGALVVAHSETGHDHAIHDAGVTLYRPSLDMMTLYAQVDAIHADVVHHRAWDTHETLRLLGSPDGPAYYEIKRQREFVPEGWRRVED